MDYARLTPRVIPCGGASRPKATLATASVAFGLAEREGFEPPVRIYYRQRFSRPPHSTTLPSLLFTCKAIISFSYVKISFKSFYSNVFQELFLFFQLLYNDHQSACQGSTQYLLRSKVSTVAAFHAY